MAARAKSLSSHARARDGAKLQNVSRMLNAFCLPLTYPLFNGQLRPLLTYFYTFNKVNSL